jgi:ribosomal protein S21
MNVQVTVSKGDVTKALKRLKKKVEHEGVMSDIRRQECYRKPCEAPPREAAPSEEAGEEGVVRVLTDIYLTWGIFRCIKTMRTKKKKKKTTIKCIILS